MFRVSCLIAFLLVALVLVSSGCSGDSNTVIMPGEGYQYTEQEQANRDQELKMLSELKQE